MWKCLKIVYFANPTLQKSTFAFAQSYFAVQKRRAELIAYPITRHILDPNEPNMAYEIIKDNIFVEDGKQRGIKIVPKA